MNATMLYTSQRKIYAKFISKDFQPDGDLGKKIWRIQKDWIKFNHDVYYEIRYPQSETQVAALWSLNNIYFGFRCKYSTINVYDGEDPIQERWGALESRCG